MNRLTIEKRVQVISALVEGNSLRSTVRMTGVALNTIQKLLADLGRTCTEYQDKAMRNLTCKPYGAKPAFGVCQGSSKPGSRSAFRSNVSVQEQPILAPSAAITASAKEPCPSFSAIMAVKTSCSFSTTSTSVCNMRSTAATISRGVNP